MFRLILLRHGESIWNKENRFTGWQDVDLSAKGQEEATAAGQKLKKAGLEYDIIFTSVLKRAIRTAWIVADQMNRMWVPLHHDWRLNERHYGNLEGLNKAETAQKFGEQQVQRWRRSYSVRPPSLETLDPRHPSHDPRYAAVPAGELPAAESLADTEKRLLKSWNERISPVIVSGGRVLIAAHHNSLRSLMKHLDRLSDEEVTHLEIPTGSPVVYELDEGLRPLRHYYVS